MPMTYLIRNVLNQVTQAPNHRIHFFPRIMLAERESDRNLVGVVVDGPNNVRPLLRPTGTGAATGRADMMDVEVEQQHFGFFGLRERNAKHGIEAASQRVAIEG